MAVRIETILSTHPDYLHALTYQITKYKHEECKHGLCHSSGVIQLAADIFYGRITNEHLWNTYKFVVLEQRVDGRKNLKREGLIDTLLKGNCPPEMETIRFEGPIPFELGEPFGKAYTREGLFLTGHYSYSCMLEEIQIIEKYQSVIPPSAAPVLSATNPLSTSSSSSSGVVGIPSTASSPFATPESADAVLTFLEEDLPALGSAGDLRFLDLDFAPDALRFSS